MPERCDAITKRGKPCRGYRLPGKSHCLAHDPTLAEARREGSRKGGAERATARRAAKQWAMLGSQLENEDIPAILKSCMFAVKAGKMEPAQATAIANLARTAAQLVGDFETDRRIEALEKAAGLNDAPSNVRRIS